MHFKSLPKIALTIFILLVLTNLQASDFSTIYNRMYKAFLSNPSDKDVESVLINISENGSFPDLDYSNKRGVRQHPDRLSVLASAYKNPDNKFYHNVKVKDAYLKGLNFWIDTNHNASNWWVRYIAYPKEVRVGVILMSDEIKANQALFDKTIKYLRWSYESSIELNRHNTGANGVDIIMGSIAASVITENRDQMVDFRNKMDSLTIINNDGTGIENDYMFGQHSGNGRQLYIGNYGKEYLNSVLSYLEFCNGTIYNTSHIALIEDHFINAFQWIFFSKNYDPNQSGRMLGTNNINTFIGLAERIVALNTPRKIELEIVLNRVKGENSLTGNHMFWRFDYMIHRRANYFTSSRMTSTRTVGNEAGNGGGERNYYSSNGVNYVLYTGKEYSDGFFNNFNERQFPGITAEQDTKKLPIPNWGSEGNNGNAFAGGASDGIYGICGMFLQRRGVEAKKAWFYFDDEYVCLGAGINQKDGSASVYTVMNQCNISTKTEYSVNGKTSELISTATLINPDWISQGGIAYFNIDKSSTVVVSNSGKIFSANIDHGTNPTNKTYAYVVKPDVSNSSDAATYSKAIPVKVEANANDVQAVRHIKLNITEVVFYKAGKLALSSGSSITVDKPCAIVFNENTNKVTVANPLCESDNPAKINVSISKSGHVVDLTLNMPDGYKAGSSVTLTAQ